jgi:hypothetical protein
LAVAVAIAPVVPGPMDSTFWYSIVTAEGLEIGHASHQVQTRSDGLHILDIQEAEVGEQSGALSAREELARGLPVSHSVTISRRTERIETSGGNTASVQQDVQTGRDWSQTKAIIVGHAAQVTRRTPVDSRTVEIPLPPSVRFDGGEGLLLGWNATASPRLEFDAFDVGAMALENVVIERAGEAPAELAGPNVLIRKRYIGAELADVSWLEVDSHGQIVETAQPRSATTILIKATDRDTATRTDSVYHGVSTAMIRSPFVIPPFAMNGHIRYRFALRFGVEFRIPETGEQHVTADKNSATLDICEGCGAGLPTDHAYIEDALKPTVWLQSDAPEIQKIALAVKSQAISDTHKMELLLKAAKPYLGRVDFVGHFSALETMARGAGDCTEAAVLLAAFGRTAGIPTRVADGLVYSRESYHGVSNAFMPHSWTLAYVDGTWRSFDLALETFDATHIALIVGDGDEWLLSAAAQRAGLLQWQDMAEIRARPAN